MAKGLRELLIGAWKLVSYEVRPVDGSRSFYPLSEQPMGIILYTPDGYMSAQISRPDRSAIASEDWFNASDDEYKRVASTYFAYTGEFHVEENVDENEDEKAQKLTHSMFISLFPNWIGQTQPRAVKIEGDDLYISSAAPYELAGKTVNSYLHWKRAVKSSS